MSRWFRHYVGMASDPKFGGVARRCSNVAATVQVSRADVLFVWSCILESAAEGNSSNYTIDADAVAEMMGVETEIVGLIHEELQSSGLVKKGQICKWDARQFTSDNSTQRSRKHRATVMQRCATPPDTETYTDTEKKKEREAREQVRATPPNPPADEIKTSKKIQRGVRWPSDAIVPDDWLEAGELARLESQLPAVDLRAEATKFANYWAAKSGGSATKIDWRRTWINWALNAHGAQNGQRNRGKSQLEQIADIARHGLGATVVDQ
jgi:hypothetical protein